MASAPLKSYRARRRGATEQHANNQTHLDPDAAVFQPNQQYAPQGMNYQDLMYYNYGGPYEAYPPTQQPPPTYPAYDPTGYTYNQSGYYDQNSYYYSTQFCDENFNPNQDSCADSGIRGGRSEGGSGARYNRGRGGSTRGYASNRPGARKEERSRENCSAVSSVEPGERDDKDELSKRSRQDHEDRGVDSNRRREGRKDVKGGARGARANRPEPNRDRPEPNRDRPEPNRDRPEPNRTQPNRDTRKGISVKESSSRNDRSFARSRTENGAPPPTQTEPPGRTEQFERRPSTDGQKNSSAKKFGDRKATTRTYDKRNEDGLLRVSMETNRDKGRDSRQQRSQELRKTTSSHDNNVSRNTNRSKRNDDGGESPRDPRGGDRSFSGKVNNGRRGTETKSTEPNEPERKSSNAVQKAEEQKAWKIDVFDFRRIKKAGNEEMESQRGRLVDELTNSTYECMVCCDVVRQDVAVWCCGECYHVFHLYCIKKWARSPSALVDGTETGWRCPGCQNVSLKVPNQYLCFCSKQRDPQFSHYETPHSCGEVCGKNRGGHCKHKCNILCHPGPCPSCNAMINKSCNCGKTKRSLKCSQGAEIQCEEKCTKVLNCGKHRCQQICHGGNCQPCEEDVEQSCHCGKGYRKVTCGSKESFYPKYNCGELCGKQLSCENHHCERICHENECDPCTLSPDNVKTCRCGKTELMEMNDSARTLCTDSIPTCDKVCGKELPCGPEAERHRCSQTCHQGSCVVCENGVTPISCRCGSTVTEMTCQEAEKYLTEEEYLCTRRCNKKRKCGKHKCQTPCCTDQEHTCIQTCGRKLTCGLHRCEEPCHRGTCHTCWNVSFEEVTCHCGAASLDPPVPCGTRPPECRQICHRRHDCQHTVRHSCHSEEKCPPCTELTKKMCLGEHELRHNIPCHIAEISCGLRCGKQLPCVQHKCIKTCHKSECLTEEEVCEQACRKPRPWCDHLCGVPCHPGVPCPETLCETEVEVRCVCGNRSEVVHCGAGKRDAQAKIYQQMTNSTMIGKIIYVGNGQTIDINSLNSKKRQLECNEDCAKVERNRRLALALQIENPDLSDKLGAPNYADFLKDFAKANLSFAAEIEKALGELVQNAKSSKFPNRSHSFKPMKRDQRRFIHEIAEFYGCKTQSYDYEPVKSVVATAHKGKCWMPNMTLTASVKRQTQPCAPLPIPHNSTEKDIRAKSTASRLSTTVLQSTGDAKKTKNVSRAKFVDYFDFDDSL